MTVEVNQTLINTAFATVIIPIGIVITMLVYIGLSYLIIEVLLRRCMVKTIVWGRLLTFAWYYNRGLKEEIIKIDEREKQRACKNQE